MDINAAAPYTLPNNLLELAEAGSLLPHTAPINVGAVIPSIPVVMPDGSMQ